MTGPRWPQTCSHPIYARTLTGVYQAVRMFSPCYFHVIISIGVLESDSLSLSTPSRTKLKCTHFKLLCIPHDRAYQYLVLNCGYGEEQMPWTIIAMS